MCSSFEHIDRRGFLRRAVGIVGATAFSAMRSAAEETKMEEPSNDQEPVAIPRDPYDALTLENDIVGMRLWGPHDHPTLSLGRSDIWDRRWFADRQPLVTMAQIKELASADRLSEVAPQPNRTVYDLYHRYDFPCPKPGGQVILGCPFATETRVHKRPDGVIELSAVGPTSRFEAEVWVSMSRSLVVLDCRCEGLAAGDLWIRVWRHRDTVLPGQPVSETLGEGKSGDFEPLPPPRAFSAKVGFGIIQSFPAEMTFPDGFQAVVAATILSAEAQIECVDDVPHLGTLHWAPEEGRLDHGTLKRYTPMNQSPGCAATARLTTVRRRFGVLVAIATTHDDTDAVAAAVRTLREARRLGVDGLRSERDREYQEAVRNPRATVRVGKDFELSAPEIILPRLRKPQGHYSDVPLCTVANTKLWFQDVGLWHNDFHFNELRAEPMLTLGQTSELLPYCELIRNLLPMAEENAREVYGLPGAMYPLVHFPLRTRGICHTNLTWEQDMGLDGLVSKPLWLYFRHTGDREFLRHMAWPVLASCAKFCRAYLTEEEDGCLHIVPTVSPEHWGLTANFERNRDCLSAVTLMRYLFRAAAKAAEILNVPTEEAADWLAAAQRLAPYPTYESEAGPVWVDVDGAPPIEYNVPVPLANVFWGDDVGLDSPAEAVQLARRTMEQIRIWKPHSFYVDACIRNRLGAWKDGAQLHPENFLLSYQSIRIFPCVPPTGEIVMESFAAEGGFLVSAVRKDDGRIEDFRIVSRLGGACRVANPWPQRAITVEGARAELVAVTAAGAGHIEFPTQPNRSYSIRPQ
jgi:hypothetical protein